MNNLILVIAIVQFILTMILFDLSKRLEKTEFILLTLLNKLAEKEVIEIEEDT